MQDTSTDNNGDFGTVIEKCQGTADALCLLIGSGSKNDPTELTVLHNIFIVIEEGANAVFVFHLTNNVAPLYLVKIEEGWIDTPMECLYDKNFYIHTKRKSKKRQEFLPMWDEAKKAGLAQKFIKKSPELGNIPLSKASYKPSAGILIHRELFAYIATQGHHQDDSYTISAMSLLQALIQDKNKAQVKRFGSKMDELMVYLWAVAVNCTDSTPFKYSLPDKCTSMHRFINNISFDFMNFSTSGNNPAKSPATLRQNIKRLSAPASDNNKLQSSRSFGSTTITSGRVNSTARDGIGLSKSVAFTNLGRRARGTPRKKGTKEQSP